MVATLQVDEDGSWRTFAVLAAFKIRNRGTSTTWSWSLSDSCAAARFRGEPSRRALPATVQPDRPFPV